MLLRRLASISRLHGTLLHFHPARFALLQLPPLPSLTTPYSTLSTPMPRPTASYNLSQLPQQDWRIEDGKDGRSFAVLSKEVDKSPNDRDREYRFLTLGNGLRVLLISDKTTDKAAAALGVQVGHLSDPDDLPGLAHFCEHMLFLGTEKYPDEAEYKTYLSRNSGSSNAYTSLGTSRCFLLFLIPPANASPAAETVYHFDCTPSGLPGALSRHAQFFTAPLFEASCTERELNAVDSEFRRNLSLDARRLFQLGKSLSSPASVYRKFGTGSLETLKKDDVRERLLEWHGEHYSANIMNLVVVSNHTLDELSDLVHAEYADIPNTNAKLQDYVEPPITPAEAKTEISFRTIKDSPQLRIEFGLPDLRAEFATKPARYVSHFIGHEGPGSILADLKERGWATSLSSGSGNGARGFDFFRISINMTHLGLKNYRQILSIVGSYLDLIKSTPPLEWAWRETQQLGQLSWRWKEKGQVQSTVRNLASSLGESLYPPERALVGAWFATEWDADKVKEVLELVDMNRCRVFVGAKEPLEGREAWKQVEQYYGTEYDIYPLDISALQTPVSPPAKLALPAPNIFIPASTELVTKQPVAEPYLRPTLVRKTSGSRVWAKTDDTWCVPRGTAYLRLRSAVASPTPRQAILTQLFTSLVEESLAKYSYDASLASLDYSFGTESDGVLLCVSGYTDKLSLLQSVVLEKIRSLKVDQETFNLVHDRLARAYKNAKLNNPYQLADSHVRLLTRETHWSYDDRLEALQGLQPSDVEEHATQLFAEVTTDSLVHGNFRRDEAVALVDSAERILQSRPADPAKNDYHRGLILPEGSTIAFRQVVPDAGNLNSALSSYFQVGPVADHELMAELSLFAQIAKVPIFSQLRTVQQLGYIVSSASWVSNARAGFRVVVQSERPPEYLDERVEELWKTTFQEHLSNMTEEEFEKEKEAVTAKKLEKAKSLGQETGRYWTEIESGELDFFHRERQASLVRQLSKSDITAFFDRFISPSSPTRTKLSILMRSQRLQPSALEPFLETVRSSSPSSSVEEATKLVASKPTIAQIDAFVAQLEACSKEEVEADVKKLKELAPLPEGTRELQEEEIEAFRNSLPRAEGYKPVATYEEDLAVSSRL